jgi:hypothetical protein
MQTLTPAIIIAAIDGFESQKVHIDSQIAELRSLLSGESTESAATPSETSKPKRIVSATARRKMAAAQKARWAGIKKAEPSASVASETTKPHKKFSAATRRKMAAAQRARYAKLKQASEPTQAVTTKPKRKMSAAGRKAISDATKKRWAAVKAAKKVA